MGTVFSYNFIRTPDGSAYITINKTNANQVVDLLNTDVSILRTDSDFGAVYKNRINGLDAAKSTVNHDVYELEVNGLSTDFTNNSFAYRWDFWRKTIPSGGTGLPTPTVAASTLQNVGGTFVEVLEKRVSFTGTDLTLNSGDTGRQVILPDTDILLEINGFLIDVVVSGQPRFLNDDYIFTASNQIRFDFSILDNEIIYITYKIEA